MFGKEAWRATRADSSSTLHETPHPGCKVDFPASHSHATVASIGLPNAHTHLQLIIMTNILLVEREKATIAARRESNEAQRPQASIKANLSTREAQLQLMAAKEKARRLEAAKKGAPQKEHPAPRPPSAQSASSNKEQSQPPHTEPSQGQQPQTQPQSRGVCTVVKIHPDGFVDLQLSSGEVIERVEQSWLERLVRAPPEGVPPPSASASRPSTAASERPPTAASRASSRPPTASLSLSQANAAAASTANVPPAASKPPGTANSLSMRELAAVVNLDETLAGMGRRGGRGNIGAQRAALSDMSSLLSWQ